MNCITHNLHMDVLRCKIESQFTLEQDCNVTDSKPDITHILLSDGFIKVEEQHPGNGEITIRGKLHYRILYSSDDSFGTLNSLQGKIPFEECIQVSELTVSDNPQVTVELEHLQIHSINSRKLNIRAILLVNGLMEDIEDTPLCHDIEDCGEEAQLHHCRHNLLNLCVMKKDICRVREELKLSSGLPEMAELLWEQTQVCNLEFHPTDGKLLVKGELSVLLLYLARNEHGSIECFESLTPFQCTLECTGCMEGLIPHITYTISQKDYDILPDVDGLERIVGIDLALELCMKLYEDVPLSVVDDLYGIHCEITPSYTIHRIKKLLAVTSAKMRLDKDFSFGHTDTVLQVKCSNVRLCPERCQPTEDGIEIEGFLALEVLTVTEDDRFPYRTQKAEIPFDYVVNVPALNSKALFEMSANLETCQITPSSGDTLTLRCTATFDVFAYSREDIDSIHQISCTPYRKETLENMAGLTVYYIREGDTLWSIGKDCLTPLQTIRDHNALTSDILTPGQKLLVLR